MLALGCFLPLVMLAIGAVLGSLYGDIRGGYWGAAAGLVAGILIVTACFTLLSKVRRSD